MKRREFISAAASLTAVGLMPGTVFSQAVMAAEDFTVEAYDDNKVVRVYDRKISNYAFFRGSGLLENNRPGMC